ncbi:hypothetical protein BH11CYA1_BH11CYA1_40010 [soil metagenome]
MPQRTRNRITNRSKYGSGLAEFIPALFVFLFIIALPLINLLTFAMGFANVGLLGTQCAVDAANASSYPDALAKVQSRATSITTSGMGRFAKMVPIGGYNGCGVNVFITETDINTKTVVEYGPNVKMTAAYDPSNKIYEYTIKTSFNIGPFMSLGAVPFVGGIPMIGVPTPVSTAAHRAVEHSEAISMWLLLKQFSLLASTPSPLPSMAIIVA